MTRFVRLTNTSGETVYVNPDHVLLIESGSQGKTVLHLGGLMAVRGFGGNSPPAPISVWVKGAIEEIVPLLSEGG